MEDDASTHPDEGTIHAWLDGALDATTAAGIAAHVRDCVDCAERVAEARGLIAGASRIVGSLDDVPAGTRPGWAAAGGVAGGAPVAAAPPAGATDASLWRWLRVTPARAAIAATLIVAVGITLTRQRTAVEGPEAVARVGSTSDRAPMGDPAREMGRVQASPAPPAEKRAQDHVLDSAVARNLAIAQPRRAMSAAPGAAIPTAPIDAASASVPADTLAGLRVAEGRRALQSQRVAGSDERADKVRTGPAASAPRADVIEGRIAANATDAVVAPRAMAPYVAEVTSSGAVAGAKACYKLESSIAGATWGGAALPLIVAADSGARVGVGSARVLTADGKLASLGARWVRGQGDSITLSLSRLGYTGTIALGPNFAGGRAGLARSEPAVTQREEPIVATGSSAARARALLPVTMRPISCPTR